MLKKDTGGIYYPEITTTTIFIATTTITITTTTATTITTTVLVVVIVFVEIVVIVVVVVVVVIVVVVVVNVVIVLAVVVELIVIELVSIVVVVDVNISLVMFYALCVCFLSSCFDKLQDTQNCEPLFHPSLLHSLYVCCVSSVCVCVCVCVCIINASLPRVTIPHTITTIYECTLYIYILTPTSITHAFSNIVGAGQGGRDEGRTGRSGKE